ncbi:MAG: hypothetical protein IJX53_00700 [Clostridia bacterium]|nr:hypothetical protein [Clostridia bacterium]
MELHFNDKTYRVELTNRRMVAVLDALGADDISDVIFTGATKNDVKTLATLIAGFTDVGNAGNALDLLDEYRRTGHTPAELYGELAKALNDEYFFAKRMTDEELAAELANPLRMVDMEAMVRQAAEDAIRSMATSRLKAKARGK